VLYKFTTNFRKISTNAENTRKNNVTAILTKVRTPPLPGQWSESWPSTVLCSPWSTFFIIVCREWKVPAKEQLAMKSKSLHVMLRPGKVLLARMAS
jgi:hypothetical protein